MEIRRLQIKSFGKIHDMTLELTPGINVLYGENESGKSTIHAFLKGMLYGLPRQRGRNAKNDPVSRYEPWEDGYSYGGNLLLTKEGKEFRISRSFSKENPSLELFCETDMTQLDPSEGDLDELLGDVGEEIFDNTVSIAQLKSVTGKELAAELRNYMAGFQGTGDTAMDLGRAVQMMKMTRKGFQVEEEKKDRIRKEELQKIQTKRDYAAQELTALHQTKEEAHISKESQLSSLKEHELLLEDNQEVLKDKQKVSNLLYLLFSIACFGAAALLYVGLDAWFYPLIPAIIYGLCTWIYIKKKNAGAKENLRYLKMLQRIKQKRLMLKSEENSIAEQIREKQTDLNNLDAQLRELNRTGAKHSSAWTEIQALNLAMDTMDMLTKRFQSRVGYKLRARTSEILSEITDGKYKDVLLDDQFAIRIYTEDRLIPMENLSRGTIEQVYFALRMAAGELLCREESFPVILDDVFGMYDEERLGSVLHYLEKEEKQVILFTCNQREKEILLSEGIPFHFIHLCT